MTSRTRPSTIRIVPADEPDIAPSAQPLPILATSLFCDDVRIEANGKLMLIGCYPGNIILLNAAQPVDRLWVVTRVTWPRDFDATGMRLRIDMPTQEPNTMPVQTNPPSSSDASPSATCVWQLRFLPLRPGDVVKVAIECDGRLVRCGELFAGAQPQRPAVTRH